MTWTLCRRPFILSPSPSQLLYRLARTFYGPRSRRAVVIHGPAGAGKSAFAVEFAHFATAPGRLFSCAPLLLRLTTPELGAAMSGLEEQLDALASWIAEGAGCVGSLGPLPRGSAGALREGPGRLSRSDSMASSRSDCTELSLEPPDGEGSLSTQAVARNRVLRVLQQLRRTHRLTRLLLIIDDEASYVGQSVEFRRLLGELLDHAPHLHLLVLSNDPVYEPLGATKTVSEPIEALSEMDAARLFLSRIHRRLERADLAGASPASPTAPPADRSTSGPTLVERTCWQLCGHPLMARLAGHPGRICSLAARVTPGGPTLYELAVAEDLFAASDVLDAAHRARRRRTLPQKPVSVVQRPLRPFSAPRVPRCAEDASDVDLR